MLNIYTLHKLYIPKCFLFFQVNPFDFFTFFYLPFIKKVGVSWKRYYLKSHCEIALLHNGTKMYSIWSRICIVFIESYRSGQEQNWYLHPWFRHGRTKCVISYIMIGLRKGLVRRYFSHHSLLLTWSNICAYCLRIDRSRKNQKRHTVAQTSYPSVFDFWKIKLEKSSSTHWNFSLFQTGFLLPV